jgi:fructokinase
MHWRGRTGQGELPAFRVRTMDTTAAGDAFVGGLLSELARRGIDGAAFAGFAADDTAVAGVLRFGAAVGALAASRHGAFAAMPTLAEVTALMENADA